jgi:hypothetical protein
MRSQVEGAQYSVHRVSSSCSNRDCFTYVLAVTEWMLIPPADPPYCTIFFEPVAGERKWHLLGRDSSLSFANSRISPTAQGPLLPHTAG